MRNLYLIISLGAVFCLLNSILQAQWSGTIATDVFNHQGPANYYRVDYNASSGIWQLVYLGPFSAESWPIQSSTAGSVAGLSSSSELYSIETHFLVPHRLDLSSGFMSLTGSLVLDLFGPVVPEPSDIRLLMTNLIPCVPSCSGLLFQSFRPMGLGTPRSIGYPQAPPLFTGYLHNQDWADPNYDPLTLYAGDFSHITSGVYGADSVWWMDSGIPFFTVDMSEPANSGKAPMDQQIVDTGNRIVVSYQNISGELMTFHASSIGWPNVTFDPPALHSTDYGSASSDHALATFGMNGYLAFQDHDTVLGPVLRLRVLEEQSSVWVDALTIDSFASYRDVSLQVTLGPQGQVTYVIAWSGGPNGGITVYNSASSNPFSSIVGRSPQLVKGPLGEVYLFWLDGTNLNYQLVQVAAPNPGQTCETAIEQTCNTQLNYTDTQFHPNVDKVPCFSVDHAGFWRKVTVAPGSTLKVTHTEQNYIAGVGVAIYSSCGGTLLDEDCGLASATAEYENTTSSPQEVRVLLNVYSDVYSASVNFECISAAPDNEEYADALNINCGYSVIGPITNGASASTSPVAAPCSLTGVSDVWYRFDTGPEYPEPGAGQGYGYGIGPEITITFDDDPYFDIPIGSGGVHDGFIALYHQVGSSLQLVDSRCGRYQHKFQRSIKLGPNHTYYIRIGSTSPSPNKSFSVTCSSKLQSP